MLSIAIIFQIFVIITKAIELDKEKFVNKINKLSSAKIEIKGKVNIKFNPLPKITISHIRIRDFKIGNYKVNIRAKKLQYSVSLINFITRDFKLHNLIIDNAKLEFLSSAKDNYNIQEILLPLFKNKTINHITIRNSKFDIISPNNNKINQYKDLDLTLTFDEQIKLNMYFSSQLENFNIIGDIKHENNNIKTDFKLSFSDSLLNFNGQYDESNKFYGKVKIAGKDIKKFIFNNLFSMWFFFPDSNKYNFDMSFDFAKSDSELNITNGKLSSDVIKGVFATKQNNNNLSGLDINLIKLDFNKLISKQKKSYIMEEMAFLKLNERNTSFPLFVKQENVKINLVIASLILNNNNIKNINLNLLLNNDKTKVNDLSFSLMGSDKNTISGYFDYIGGKYNFIGQHIITGNDINKLISTFLANIKFNKKVNKPYKFTTKFTLNTDLIKIDKLQGNIANGNILGDIIFYFSEGTDANINLDINNINFNDFILLNNRQQPRHLLHHIYEIISSRESNNSLLGELLWLRNLYYNVAFDISFYNSLYNKHNFEQIKLKGTSKYRELLIKELKFLSADNNFTSNLEVNLDEKLPFININIDAQKINLEFLNYLEQYSKNKYEWSKDMTLIPNFNNIGLSLKADIKNLKYKELNLLNSNWLFEVQNNILYVKNAQGLIDEGSFKVNGQLILDGLPTLNLTYKLTEFQFGNFVKLFFNIPHIDAKTNWAGSLYSSGNTPYIMIKQLRSKNKFYLADIKINNFAIKQLIQEIANLSSDPINSLNVPVAQMIKNGNTIFQTSTGELNIKNGQIILNNINLNGNNIKGVVAGKIDLVNFIMKLNSVFIFTAYYRVKDHEVKKSALRFTHQLQGKFDNISGKFNLVQLESFVTKLKEHYVKLYNEIMARKKLKKSKAN